MGVVTPLCGLICISSTSYLLSMYLLIGEFNPFTFKVITSKGGLSLPFYCLFLYVSYLYLIFSSSNTAFFCVLLFFSSLPFSFHFLYI